MDYSQSVSSSYIYSIKMRVRLARAVLTNFGRESSNDNTVDIGRGAVTNRENRAGLCE